MATRQRLTRSERYRSLLEVAQRVFGKNGYRKTEMSELAREAGVTKPMLYRHFPGGKAEVFMTVLEGHLNALVRTLWEAMSSSSDPRERLYRGLDAYIAFAERNPEGFHLMTDSSAELDSTIGARMQQTRNLIADGLSRTIADVMKGSGLDGEGAPIYAHALLGAVESVVLWWLESETPSRDRLVGFLLAFVWRGFDGLPRDPTRFQLDLAARGKSSGFN
jgi:AcrR family transcriptional regulator